jgi:hypothetical protein
MTVECPFCDKTGPTKEFIAQHAFTTGDEAHSGVNYQKAMMHLNTDATSGSSSLSADSDSGADNPVFGDANPDTVGTSTNDPDGDTDSDSGANSVALPCGCETIDPADAPEPPYQVTCGTCGTTYKVNE